MQAHNHFDQWNHAVHSVCGRFVTRPAAREELFIGEIRHHDLGGLGMADIYTNASSIVRERGSASRSDDRFYFLVMQRQGVMAINRDHEQFVLHPGEVALLDSASSFELQPQGLIRQLSVHICRDALDRAVPATARRFGKLERNSLSGHLLAGLIQQMANGNPGLPTNSHDGAALQDALISLIQPSLPDEGCQGRNRPLRRMAEKLIQEALPNVLPPAELAARLNVSVRQLYRQFEHDGDSICRYIQRQRLARSASALANPDNNAMRITTIAYDLGFSDSAHFSKAFKREYGLSPREYRTRSQAT